MKNKILDDLYEIREGFITSYKKEIRRTRRNKESRTG